MNRVQFVIIVTVTVLWSTFASIKIVLWTSHKQRSTVETTKIAADSVKFYCRLLVKLGLPIQNWLNWTVFSISFHKSWNWSVWGNKRVLLQVSAPLFLVDYVCHVFAGKEWANLSSKVHGPLQTLCFMNLAHSCILISVTVMPVVGIIFVNNIYSQNQPKAKFQVCYTE